MYTYVYFSGAQMSTGVNMKPKKVANRKSDAVLPRRRDGAETRKAILLSARAAFARCGYDGVGVREIAQSAGVTGILVNRYFGSKEQLFSEVIASTMANPGILSSENLKDKNDQAGMGRRIATALVMESSSEAEKLDGFLILLRSASNERAADIWRENIEQHYEKSLVARLSGKRAKERAGLILALIAGVQIMRQAIGTTSLVESDPKWLIETLTDLFQSLVVSV